MPMRHCQFARNGLLLDLVRHHILTHPICQPVFQGEYPGWSFEPGLRPRSSRLQGGKGQDPVRKMDNGSPEVEIFKKPKVIKRPALEFPECRENFG